MKPLLFSFIIIIAFISCHQAKTEKKDTTLDVKKVIVIDLKKIAGKSKIEVEKILGQPEKIENFSESICKKIPCNKVYYQKEKFEIIFINDKADWITINNLSEYDFDEGNIEIFGLTQTDPEFNNPQDLIRWKNIEGISEINIFNNGSNKISYAYIKVVTK